MNYWDYIKVEQLLALQTGVRDDGSEPDNDEVLFITVHQVYELWFKLVLRELDALRSLFLRNPVPDQALAAAVRGLRRAVTVFEVATHHWRLVETLTTRDYLAFRDQLVGASGFQSAQLREIEILLGLEERVRIPVAGSYGYREALHGPKGESTPALARVQRRLDACDPARGGSYKDALYEWLSRTPIDGSSTPAQVDAYVERFLDAHAQQKERLLARHRDRIAADALALLEQRYQRDVDMARAFLRVEDRADLDPERRTWLRHVRAAVVFIESHRELPRLAWPREVLEATLALEQAMIVWRQRHARMVERVIGRRTGTGGSGGVDYLDETALRYRIFDELWTVRTLLLRAELVPELSHAEDYRFKVED